MPCSSRSTVHLKASAEDFLARWPYEAVRGLFGTLLCLAKFSSYAHALSAWEDTGSVGSSVCVHERASRSGNCQSSPHFLLHVNTPPSVASGMHAMRMQRGQANTKQGLYFTRQHRNNCQCMNALIPTPSSCGV